MALSITNPLYPKASWASNAAVASQSLSVTSTAAVQKTTEFNTITDLVMFDVKTNTVYVTVDGSTPTASGTVGHALSPGTQYTWSKGLVSGAKFIGGAGTATIYFSELSV